MSTLLDTNIPSELLRAQPHSAMLAWFAEQSADSLFVSVVTRAKTFAAPVGWSISQFDARIAVITLSHPAGFTTCNVSDFEDCGLALTDPWSAF